MSIADYVVLASLLIQLVVAARGHHLTKAAIEKALGNNRALLAKTLADIVTRFKGL